MKIHYVWMIFKLRSCSQFTCGFCAPQLHGSDWEPAVEATLLLLLCQLRSDRTFRRSFINRKGFMTLTACMNHDSMRSLCAECYDAAITDATIPLVMPLRRLVAMLGQCNIVASLPVATGRLRKGSLPRSRAVSLPVSPAVVRGHRRRQSDGFVPPLPPAETGPSFVNMTKDTSVAASPKSVESSSLGDNASSAVRGHHMLLGVCP